MSSEMKLHMSYEFSLLKCVEYFQPLDIKKGYIQNFTMLIL
jgi:hypothetical protein